VGPIKIGDSLEGFINDRSMFKVNIKWVKILLILDKIHSLVKNR
jgi:hypothetical protein